MKPTTEKKNLLKGNVDKAYIKKAISYHRYLELINSFLHEEKSTAPKYSDTLVQYTRLNIARMNRLDKTTEIIPELKAAIERPVILQELFYHLKAKALTDDAIKEEIHKWYAQDKTVTIQIELLQILNNVV